MAQAAKRQFQDHQPGSFPTDSAGLVRRLLSPRAVAAGPLATRPVMTPVPAPVVDDEDAIIEDPTVTILKAALRSERAEVETLQAELAELRAAHQPLAEARVDRDRWAGLVERLVLQHR